MASGHRVRLDKWLWAARFFRTRTQAADAVMLGRVRINGERSKPAREARVGDRIEVSMGDGCREVVIRELSMQRGGAPSAQQLYEETADSLDRRERRQERLRYAVEPARSIRKGRPTKREGRQLRTVRGSTAAD